MPTKPFSDKEYRATFTKRSEADHDINKLALERALDIRKFEIELYWKRAAYFWTFIAATFAGFVAVQASASEEKADLSILLCHLGAVFSFAWICVNRGSKFWQENWENHVDMLEDKVNGPLYKVVLSRAAPVGTREHLIHLITGPTPFSVSKINQMISLFMTLVWITLVFHSLPEFRLTSKINFFYVSLSGLSLAACALFCLLGKRFEGGYWHRGSIRTSSINNRG